MHILICVSTCSRLPLFPYPSKGTLQEGKELMNSELSFSPEVIRITDSTDAHFHIISHLIYSN